MRELLVETFRSIVAHRLRFGLIEPHQRALAFHDFDFGVLSRGQHGLLEARESDHGFVGERFGLTDQLSKVLSIAKDTVGHRSSPAFPALARKSFVVPRR